MVQRGQFEPNGVVKGRKIPRIRMYLTTSNVRLPRLQSFNGFNPIIGHRLISMSLGRSKLGLAAENR
jgi:hypothetical protein